MRPAAFLACLGTLAAPVLAQQGERDGPIRVLYLEDVPRWEFRYLRTVLQRMPGVEFTAVLGDGDTGAAFPKTREEFLAYDVILLGDISLHGDAAGRQDWMLHLMDFVDRGGGVAFLCGSRAMPETYRGTLLEKLLPVELVARAEGGPAPAPVRGPTRPSPPEGEVHSIASLPGPHGRAIWERLGAVEEYQPVRGLAEAAAAVLVDPARNTDGRPAVVAAAGRWAKGRTFFLGTGQTWRWRNPHGDRYQSAFWGNVVSWLAGE